MPNLTSIQSTDRVSDSRSVINANFSALNSSLSDVNTTITQLTNAINQKTVITVSRSTGADYVCDGTADQVQINQAIVAANAAGGGIVFLKPEYPTKITSHKTKAFPATDVVRHG